MGNIFLGVAADDFTGASDAASFLVEAGVPTVLFNGVPDAVPQLKADTRAIVVALKTRTVKEEQAVKETLQAFDWLKRMGAGQLYLKYCSTFDSTKDGNIGPVVDTVLEQEQLPCTVLCPSLPVNGRIVKGGKLYVNGVLLEESHMKDHPLTPMQESDVAKLMEAQGRYRAVHLSVEELQEDKQALSDRRKEEPSPFYIIPDYYEDAHADRIAEVFGDLKFLTGGSGLVGALGRRYVRQMGQRLTRAGGLAGVVETGTVAGTAPETVEESGVAGKALVLAGSCSAVTLKQIADYVGKGHPSFRIDPHRLLDGSLTEEDLQNWIREQESGALIYSSASPEDIKKSQALGKERVASRIEETLSGLAKNAARQGYHRLIIAGGETSGAVTKALGYEAFYIGASVAPGVPVMIPVENPDLRLVLKSGNFGQEDFFERACEMTR